jgi:arylsulfatase
VGEKGNIKNLHTEPATREVFMAQVLKSAGYATALIGKWHLGTKGKGPGGYDPATMPNAKGFDYFFGTPLYNGFTVRVEDTKARSPILRNQNVVVPAIENWDHITGDYTREALGWIETNRAHPFFLYLAHNMPHIPLGASESFKGKSAYGPYGDAIEEIDWSTGQILAKLKDLGLDQNTLVVFTSDNGPWIEATHGNKPNGKPFIPRNHSGSADPLRGAKMTAWDGGCRVPFIARWPGKISAGRTSDEILSTMDLLPTFAALGGATLPKVTLDGLNAAGFLLGKTPTSPRDEYLYYAATRLTGVRSGRWKLELPRPDNPPETGWWGRFLEAVPATRLYDLNVDPGETTDVAAENPEVVAELMKRVERARADLGDWNRIGSGARFFDAGPKRPDMGKSSRKNSNEKYSHKSNE